MASTRSSRVNSKYKRRYRVGNWRAYERGLRARGDVSVVHRRGPQDLDVASDPVHLELIILSGNTGSEQDCTLLSSACRSRIPRQAAVGSCTSPRQ